MQLMINIAIVINIITIILFSAAEFFIFKPDTVPKVKAKCAVWMGVDLALYVISLFFVSIFGLLNHKYQCLIFLLWTISPFIIGHYATYENLKKYSISQIVLFCASLVLLFLV